MGTDVYAYAFVGVPVQESDFLVERVDTQETCSEGHVRREGAGAYCELDGGRFLCRVRKLPTEGFRQLWVSLSGDPCPHDRKQWYGDREFGTTFCGACHKDITAFVIDEGDDWIANYYKLGYDGIVRTAVAISLAGPGALVLTTGTRLTSGSSRDRERRVVSWNQADLRDQFVAVGKLAEALGLSGREPVLYLQQEWR
jgi:hypothetical protein